MKNKSSLVRFDWAIKRLLRQKSNFVVLEGLLSTLLGENVIIVRILESEGNKEDSEDKFNRIDVLAENSKGELVIIEVQNNRELDYFHRMLYGTSKAVTEYIHEGEKYGTIKKIYSVNIIYFDLGQGKDYVYHGKTQLSIMEKQPLKVSITMTFFNSLSGRKSSLSATKPAISFLNITYYVSTSLTNWRKHPSTNGSIS